MKEFSGGSWLARKNTRKHFAPCVYVQYGHYISWSNGPPYTTSRDRIVMLAEALENIGIKVVEEMISGPKEYNHSVQIMSADFEVLYTVPNIRKLGKKGFKEDAHRQPIVNAVKQKYGVLFEMKFDSVDDFGGGDMFMSSMPTPVKAPSVVAAPSTTSPDSILTPPVSTSSSTLKQQVVVEEPSMGGVGGFMFSLDEDF